MGNRSVSRKYATALSRLAEETQAGTRVRHDMESLVELLRTSPKLVSFLESPGVTHTEKRKLLERALKGRVEETVLPFMRLILRRSRIDLLADILEEYVKIDEERRGIQRAEVVSAIALEAGEEEQILAVLNRITGREIILKTKVDAAIIGGLIVYVNGDVIDGSIRTRLEELRAALLAAPVG
jgi:F-type H+-transporting ATPase subunit delta